MGIYTKLPFKKSCYLMSQHHLFILFGLSLWVQHPGIKLSVRLWVHTKKRSLLHIRRVSDEHLSSYGFACITANFHCHRLPKVSFTETKSIWSTVWRMLWKRGSSCPNSPSQSLNVMMVLAAKIRQGLSPQPTLERSCERFIQFLYHQNKLNFQTWQFLV